MQLKPAPLSTLVVETEKVACRVFSVTRTVRDDIDIQEWEWGCCKSSMRIESPELSSVKSMGRGKGSQDGTQKLFGYKGEPHSPTTSSFMIFILSATNCCRFTS